MSKSASFEFSMLKLIFNAVAITNLADNAAGSPFTGLWVGLHSADPSTAAATMGTNEVAYTGYTRIATSRTTAAGGWTITSGTSAVPASASPVSAITFPQATSTSTGTITHFSVGSTSSSTAALILYSGTVTPNINFGQNVTPSLTTGSSITED